MTVEVFVSHAYRDKILVDDLRRHLVVLERQGLINIWQDSEIAPGGEWKQAIDKYLNTADIILLMLSPDFLDSDYSYSTEMKRAIERHERGEVHVIPILLRPVYWQNAPFSHLQMLPRDGKPVTTWHNRDKAFSDITEGIRRVIVDIVRPKTSDFDSLEMPRMTSKKILSRRSILIAGLGVVTVVGSGSIFLISTRKQNTLPGPAFKLIEHPILYQADWSKGMGGWNNSFGSMAGMQIWTVKEGMLVCDGKLAGVPSKLSIIGPYQPQNADYAVETDLQLLSTTPNTAPAYFGLIGRQPQKKLGVLGYIAGISGTGNTIIDKIFWQTSDQEIMQSVTYQPSQGWHTYRLEVKNHTITFFIDNHKVIAVQDVTFSESGLVGLVASACSLNVRNFRVIGL